MKKLTILVFVSLFCGLAFAAVASNAPSSYKSAFVYQTQGTSGMDISFTLPSFEVKKELANGQAFHRIDLPDAGTLMQDGMPELPVISTTIAIPHRGSVSIEVQDAQHSILGQFNAYPLQQGGNPDSPKAFVKNHDYYSSSDVYPSSAVECSDPMILRDFRIVTIQVNPFSYNADTQELTVCDQLQLRVNFTDEAGVNELPAPVQYVSPSFDKIYSSTIQNYDDYRNLMYSNTPPRYLIIHGNTTDVNFHNALDAYALWKRQKGADVDIFSTAANQAGTSTSSIQTFIRGRYNNLATRPDYVILIGDVTGSYAIPAFKQSGGDTDFPYTHMNTGDIIGDVFLGRISVENLSQLLVLLQKIYIYERDIDVATADWLDRMLLVGDDQPSGISTKYISKYIKEMGLEINPDYSFTELYGPTFSSFVPSINAAINQGVGFYSFRGYIDFVPPTESALFNGHKLLHAINLTCGTNNFAGTSEMEQFIRYGTLAAPKGAVTAIGMSTSSTSTTFNNVLHGAIFEGIFVHEMRTMGEAIMRGRLYTHDVFGVSAPSMVANFTHWCNLMGDPTMEVFTGIPGSFQMATEDDIPLGMSLLDVAVTDADSIAVEGAAVVLSLGADIISRGYTDVEGNVILVLPEVMPTGEATLTVSSHNFKPLQSTIQIVDIPTLVPAAILIDDDNQGASQGNNNGITTAGETVEVFFGLKNTGTEAISGISGTVSSDNPWIDIVNADIEYPTIMGEAVGNNLTPIVIEVDPATPHETMLRIRLNLTDSNNNSYELSEFIPVEAARATFMELSVTFDDNEDGILDPDETANLVITLKNIGAAEIGNVYARLYTENDLISVVSNTSFIGAMLVDQPVSSSELEPFIVWQRPETLPGMVMPMYLRLYNDAGFEQIVHFTLTVGQVFQSDPLGPDSYGYVIYDWTDVAYPEVAEYSWLEIATPAGGLGTALPITDVYNSSDEGDQVGAQSLAVVNLPFPFQFYGRMYDQITVCSNGFIALGVTENGEFRNFRLPGAMGPSPMIAPFWDDLATHSGSGIYTMFDRSNHSFIIEWYNMKNGYNGSSPETFQVILYDQATYNTSLGDGPIKFQYHTFNNVNAQSGRRHGNYSTIGIEDHSGTRGLEYSFNNLYPTAAAPLSNGKALYITNVPIYHEAANLLIAATYLDDANNVVEPGESVSLGVLLENSGNLMADDIMAVLSSSDEYVNIENAESEYYPLDSGATGVNRSPFTFTVSQDCPAGHVIPFALRLQSDETVWNRSFSIQVDSSQLHYHSFLISDYEGNFNGVIDPGEAVKLIINLRNASFVNARDVGVTLSSTVPNLSIANPALTIPLIDGNQIMQVVFDLDFTGVTEADGYLPLHFTATPLSGQAADVTLQIPYNLPNVEHDFELNNGQFVSETGWVWGEPVNVDAYSGSKVWATNLSGEYPINVNYHMYTPRYVLGDNSQLGFMHNYSVEQNYDGVNVSISTNNGNSWTVIPPIGGYNGSAIAGLNSENGWTGTSNSWESAAFDLTSYAGQEVMFRFRLGSNGSITGPGWFIDDFGLSDVNLKTGFVFGQVSLTSMDDPSLATVMSSGRLATNPDSQGNYRLYLPNGTHSVTASMPDHQSSTQNNIPINVNALEYEAQFTLIDLPAVESPNLILDKETGMLTILWDLPSMAMFPPSAYRVYRRFDSGPYTLIQENQDTSYLEFIELEGMYRYYITAVYMGQEGAPTAIIEVPFPFEISNEDAQIPALTTALGKNYPNPFNPSTSISFTLAKSGPVSLKIYNAKGQLVRQLTNAEYNAGQHYLSWDGRDAQGRAVSSGLYFYRLETRDYSKSHKMILMK